MHPRPVIGGAVVYLGAVRVGSCEKLTVTIVSNDATSDSTRPELSAKVKVSATGRGSEMPVDSITK